MKSTALTLLITFLLFSAVPSLDSAPAAVESYDELLSAIRQARHESRARLEAAARAEKVHEAWEIGHLIDEHVLLHKERAEYGAQVIIRLAKDLGTSETELKYMFQFARTYPICPQADELSWAHYRELLSVNDADVRNEIAEQARQEDWGRDRLRDEIKKYKQAQIAQDPATVGAGHSSTGSGSRAEAWDASPEHLSDVRSLADITPGPLYTYPIIRFHESLRLDLGFGIYRNLSKKDAKTFKEGDIVRLDKEGALRHSPGIVSSALYTYQAVVTSVVDGDTFHALIELGFETAIAQRVRLRRIDAPELITREGAEAKTALEAILAKGHNRVVLQSRRLDQHGRPLADVWSNGKLVDRELVEQGHAVIID